MAQLSHTRITILTALAGNTAIAILKFAAAWWTGSSAMLSEAFHSTVDTFNEILLLYGQHRSDKPADAKHPLGYGRELYFWSFIVALFIFATGAGVSLYEGIARVLNPAPIETPFVAYGVLGLSFLFEGASWGVAWRNFLRTKGEAGLWAAVRESKNPPDFIVLFEDSAAIAGLAIAVAGTLLSAGFGYERADGFASIGIAAVLAVTAAVLARESKGLLIGEPASAETAAAIRAIAARHPAIDRLNGVVTIHLAPDEIMVALNADFVDWVSAGDVERAVAEMQDEIRAKVPTAAIVYITPRARPAKAG